MGKGEAVSTFWQVWSSRLSRRIALFSLLIMALIGFASFQAYRLVVQNPLDSVLPLIFALFLVAILSVGVLFFVISLSVLHPLMQLSNATLELEKGNYDARVTITSNDDLADLGRRFNTMAGALGKVRQEHQQIDSAKTEFLSITSHELRSPMTPMRAQLQMLLKGYHGNLNPKQRESLEIVLRNTERLDKIISDFLEISRIEAARLKFYFVKTNLADHITRLIEEMKGFMPEKHITLVPKLDKLPSMECDPDRIIQVLRNLLSNAIKFSPNNSKIIIRAELKKDHVQISVSDSGLGISPENRAMIFEPFFQVEHGLSRSYGGVGLGLAICKGIVEAQNGRIWVDSVLGKGSTFSFTVPLTPVRDQRPVRLLFSPRTEIEKRIHDIFAEHLGPHGAEEFQEIKRKGLQYDTLLSTIKNLRDHSAMDHFHYRKMTGEIRSLFGVSRTAQERLIDNLEDTYVSILGPLGLKQFAKVEKNLTRQTVRRQLDQLISSKILTKEEGMLFQQRVAKIFLESQRKKQSE